MGLTSQKLFNISNLILSPLYLPATALSARKEGWGTSSTWDGALATLALPSDNFFSLFNYLSDVAQ